MEKISNIVRGNARVASVDLKSSSAVRPGAPSYGRAVGESSTGAQTEGTTASRAAAIANQMNEQRRIGSDRVVEQMADTFFMSRIRRPDTEAVETAGGQPVASVPRKDAAAATPELSEVEGMESAEDEGVVQAQPQGYTPRGSYVDVRA